MIEFLQKQNSSHKSRLSIFLRKMVKSRMISINNDMRPNQIRSKFFKTKDHKQEFFSSDSVIQLGIVEPILISYKVLMITNTNVICT